MVKLGPRRRVGSRRCIIAACLAAAGLQPLAASAASPAAARSVTVVSGPAGTSVLLRVTAEAALNNAGRDVSLSSPGSRAAGLLIVRADGRGRYADTDFYDEAYATDLGMCGRSPCPVPLPARAWAFGNPADVGKPLHLRPGTYLVVLFGEAGHSVTASIRWRSQPSGVVRLRTTGAGGHLTVDTPDLAAAGRDVDASGYHLDYSPHRLFSGDLAIIATSSPGAVNLAACSHAGDGAPPAGATPCRRGVTAQFDYPMVLTQLDGEAYGTSGDLAHGPPDGYYEIGYRLSAVSSGATRLLWVAYDVALPW